MTEETTGLPGTMIMRCRRCRSPNIMRYARAVWNAAKQEWELGRIYDHSACDDCGAEECIVEIATDGTPVPPDASVQQFVESIERARAALAAYAAMVTPEGIERAKQLIAQEERDKAAAPATRMPRECATEGCENLGLVRFERGGVESHYCPDCYGLLTFDGNTPPDE